MKKIRIGLLLALLGFSGLVIYQNMGYLLTPSGLRMNLWVTDPFYSTGIINAQLILGAFFAGLLISYFLGLSSRFKNNKIIKSLNATLNSQMETITVLESKLSKCQGPTPQQDPPQSEAPVENT
jgi:hypothetical protein